MRSSSVPTFNDRTWALPVVIRYGYGKPEEVHGPREAMECLDAWPCEEGEYFVIARRTCIAAMRRRSALDEARETFVSAAIEADILAHTH
ncbi:DUF982 domain-containing protein [Neorhizobium sp. DT-125]|uniref:DUF982 domain-containing protein n=1 Tax=Neorhizobium sp. DT-125 TaxID=3396163 RepID=UPI003F1A8DF2